MGGNTAAGKGGGSRGGSGGSAGRIVIPLGGTSGTAGGSAGAGDACNCYIERRGYDCHKDSVNLPPALAHPGTCELLDATVQRRTCSDGSRQYVVDEAQKNDYVVDVDADGNPTYFSATGDVASTCGFDTSSLGPGTVTMGEPPVVTCTDPCWLCAPVEGLDACDCNVDPDDGSTVQTLEAYCAWAYCPASVDEARAHVIASCSSGVVTELVQSCDFTIVRRVSGASGVSYVFDDSGSLVRVVEFGPAPFGPCAARAYDTGEVAGGICNGGFTCSFCSGSANGESGAAGAGGAEESTTCAPG